MKRTFYFLTGCLLVAFCSSGPAIAQTIFDEDFSSATGSTPPTNWTNDDLAGSGVFWVFDNPGERELNGPISDPAAILDSDWFGEFGIDEENTLVMPSFDASLYTGNLVLTFDHYFSDQYGGECFVEVFDGSTWNEVLYYNTSPASDPEHVILDITANAGGAGDAQVRFRWVGSYSDYWVLDNVVLVNTDCPPVVFPTVSNETTTTVDLNWIAGGTETSWNIEWGLPGFTPGAGEEEGSDIASSESIEVSGLAPGTNYVFYIQADCGSETGLWISVNGATLCAAISTLPWEENFDDLTNPDYGVYQNCWYSENQYWFTDNGYNSYNTAPYSGDNFMAIYYYDGDVIWTPEFELTAGTTYELSFMYAGDDQSGWTGEILVNDAQTSSGATLLNEFISQTDQTTTDYQKAIGCFTPATTGVYTFGVNVYSNYNPYDFVTLDDFSLVERTQDAGTSGSADVCQTSGLVDLSEIVTLEDASGTWTFDPNPNVIENDSFFNPLFVPATTLNINYITSGCLEDTVVATITIFGPSTAGEDGEITACKNESISLLTGLGGTVEMGGNWIDPQGNVLPSSVIITPNIAGQYTYKYIVGNGVCPDDTARVLLNVFNTCEMSVNDLVFDEVKIYPNPSTGIVFIETTQTDVNFGLVITDINGRVIESGSQVISAGINSVDLSNVQTGIYFVKLTNASAERVYRVVIN